MQNGNKNIQLIDSHCHLDFDIFNDDRNQVLDRAKENNITDIVIPGTCSEHWNRITTLCSNKQLHACYGLHPYWTNTHTQQDIKNLDLYIDKHKPVALGECGLDFRPQQASQEKQLAFYEAQLDIANNHQLPVVIHSVKATEKIIQSIKKYKNLTGMIHSFSGSIEQAQQLINLGFYISLSGSVTYENAKKLRLVAKSIALASLLLETDAPDQTDQHNTNTRNEPAYLTNTLATIANLREASLENIAYQTTENAKTLFGI